MVGIYFFSILVCTLSSNNSSTHIYKQTWSMNKQMHSNYNKYSGHTYICLAFYIPQKSLLNNLTCSLSITQYLLRVHYVKEENELSKVTKTKNGEAYKSLLTPSPAIFFYHNLLAIWEQLSNLSLSRGCWGTRRQKIGIYKWEKSRKWFTILFQRIREPFLANHHPQFCRQH